LSDLELVALGIVWKRQPCTAYAVAREFVTSPSSHWSGSAGAIYPAVKRLASGGYLRSTEASRGRRARRAYSLTPKGARAVRRWLTPPLPPEATRITYDPIRTRVYFLAILTPAERRAFLDEADTQTRSQLEVIEAEVNRYRHAGDEFSALAMSEALYALRARLDWIRDLLFRSEGDADRHGERDKDRLH